MPNREASGNDAETIIAASVKVEGDFVSQGNVLIEGTVEGSLKTERNLRVGEQASINADVQAANATVAGEIHGNIAVSERLELEPTARIHGDVNTKSLIVANGAAVNGRVSMGQAEAQAEAAVEKVAPAKAVTSRIKSGKDDKRAEKKEPAAAEELAAEETDEQEEREEKVASAFFGR